RRCRRRRRGLGRIWNGQHGLAVRTAHFFPMHCIRKTKPLSTTANDADRHGTLRQIIATGWERHGPLPGKGARRPKHFREKSGDRNDPWPKAAGSRDAAAIA